MFTFEGNYRQGCEKQLNSCRRIDLDEIYFQSELRAAVQESYSQVFRRASNAQAGVSIAISLDLSRLLKPGKRLNLLRQSQRIELQIVDKACA